MNSDIRMRVCLLQFYCKCHDEFNELDDDDVANCLVENASLLGCNATHMLLGECFLMFQRIVVSSSSTVKQHKKNNQRANTGYSSWPA